MGNRPGAKLVYGFKADLGAMGAAVRAAGNGYADAYDALDRNRLDIVNDGGPECGGDDIVYLRGVGLDIYECGSEHLPMGMFDEEDEHRERLLVRCKRAGIPVDTASAAWWLVVTYG